MRLLPLLLLLPLAATAHTVGEIADALAAASPYAADVRFSVSLPQTDTDVAYDIRLASVSTPSDTLAPCAYLIEWTLGDNTGFTSYFNGNLYRFRDARISEYHTSWDPVPFQAERAGGGVQRAAQFASLLPQFMAGEIRAMQADPRCTLALAERTYQGRPALELKTRMEIGGATVQEKTFILDAATSLPLRTVTESNPASITEQTVITDYLPAADPIPAPLSEEQLIARYPDTFETCRESNFTIENLPGRPIPSFALPTITGERCTHELGQPFAAPTVIAIIDPLADPDFNSALVSGLRRAIELSPVPADLILAFTGSGIDAAEAISGPLRPGETHIIKASSLGRDCGAAALPVVIVASSDAKARKIFIGFNKNISDGVIQSIALASSRN